MKLNVCVSQGSIFDPTLFLFNVNDLPKVSSKLRSVHFADATTLTIKHSNYETLITEMNIELNKIKLWTLVNMVSVSGQKLPLIFFNSLAGFGKDSGCKCEQIFKLVFIFWNLQ